MIFELLDPLNAGERLSSYIDLPKCLECSASCPDRLCCLQATPRLPRATWRSLEEPISAYSGDEWRDLKWEFLTGLALFAGGRLTHSMSCNVSDDFSNLVPLIRCSCLSASSWMMSRISTSRSPRHRLLSLHFMFALDGMYFGLCVTHRPVEPSEFAMIEKQGLIA
jgi:hypothetical protein